MVHRARPSRTTMYFYYIYWTLHKQMNYKKEIQELRKENQRLKLLLGKAIKELVRLTKAKK